VNKEEKPADPLTEVLNGKKAKVETKVVEEKKETEVKGEGEFGDLKELE
jgi:hypothetical protein